MLIVLKQSTEVTVFKAKAIYKMIHISDVLGKTEHEFIHGEEIADPPLKRAYYSKVNAIKGLC